MNNFSHTRTNYEEPTVQAKQATFIAVITCSLISALIVFTLLGNVLIISAFCLCKELRTITNYFLVSLSVADLLTALLAMPIFMVSIITNDQMFPGGIVFFEVWRSIDIIFGTASIWNLCLVSLDRCLAVSCPLKHMVILTPVRAKAVIVLVWTFSTALSGSLHLNWKYRGVFITVTSFFLPLIIIIFSYSKIYQVTTRSCVLRRSGGTQLKRDIRSAKQMVLVISIFILCWFGFFVLTLILSTRRSFSLSISPVVLHILKALTYLNSSINPVLFTLVSNKFKKAIAEILRCQRPNLSRRRIIRSSFKQRRDSSYLVSSLSRKSASFQTSPATKRRSKTFSLTERETAV